MFPHHYNCCEERFQMKLVNGAPIPAERTEEGKPSSAQKALVFSCFYDSLERICTA